MLCDELRALTAKKYEILGELENAKALILREMSAVDKHSLRRIREILDHYDNLEKSVIEKMNTFDIKIKSFLSASAEDYSIYDKRLLEMSNKLNEIRNELESYIDECAVNFERVNENISNSTLSVKYDASRKALIITKGEI